MSHVDDELERLRKKILEMEKELSTYGFDRRRGVETYKVSEIKRILGRIPPRDAAAVRKKLIEIVDTQRVFYRELYRRAGVAEIHVDTEMPERNLEEIGKWLGGDQVRRESVNKFSGVIVDVLEALSRGKDVGAVIRILKRAYKRDYDRYRVLDFISSLCEELGAKIKRPLPERLEEAVSVVAAPVLELGAEKVRRMATARLGL